MIENKNKMLHKLYCYRYLYRCICGEVVDKKEKRQHDEEFHSEVPCSYCKEVFERWKLETHPCKRAPKNCPYCENTFPADEFRDHIIMCGSKTEECTKCKQYIQRTQWLIHEQSTCSALYRVFFFIT